MGLRLVTAPADEPVTLDEARAHLRETSTDNDDLISSLITVARTVVERETGRSLITQTLELTRDYFEAVDPALITPVYVTRATTIYLPRPPMQSLRSVTYLDGNGDSVTLYDVTGSPQIDDSLAVDTASQPGRIAPLANGTWPATLAQLNAVSIRYIAGYGDDGQDVPAPLLQAMKLIIGHLYEHAESVSEQVALAELPMGVTYLIAPYRVMLDEVA